jgi:hypothetical protein
MKKAFALVVLMMLVGCDKKDAAPAAASSTAAPAASAAPAVASAAAAPSAAPSAEAEAEEEYDQEGLEEGEVIVGYLQDLKDEGQCAVLPAKEAEKSKYDAKKLEEVAKMMKAKVVAKCPTQLVGRSRLRGGDRDRRRSARLTAPGRCTGSHAALISG